MHSLIEAAPTAPTRRGYLLMAAFFTMVAVYGSLVPFHFRPLPLDEALFRFSRTPYLALGIASRADFVANILLFIPLGFLAMGAARTDRRGRVGGVVAALAVATFTLLLSLAIEFTQEFFPPRTVSLNDLLAESEGALVGIALWTLAGQRITEWARAFLRERDRPAFLVRLLAAYAVVFFIVQLLPLDLTIDRGELAQKYREGRIVLDPFAVHYSSLVARLWDYAADIVLHLPIGALAVIGWTDTRRQRAASVAILLGVVFVAVVELCQVFVFTRYADATDVLTGSLGVACGVAVAIRIARKISVRDRLPAAAGVWPVLGALAWTAVLVTYHWFPFDFVITREMLVARLPLLLAEPFHSYYFGSEFHAFTEITRKLMLAVPLGGLLKLALPPAHTRRRPLTDILAIACACGLFFFVTEFGQIFLPDRIPDLTDVGIAEAGVLAGIWLAASVMTMRAVGERR